MSKKKAKGPRPRTERRQHERAARELVRDRQKLAALELGGSAERPMEVASSSVIAVRARSQPCPLCGGTLRIEHETAESATLRACDMSCGSCGIGRKLWFRIGSALPS